MRLASAIALSITITGFSVTSTRAEESPASAAPAAKGERWTDNFVAAKAQAAKENKDILINFTGSDWCGWCIKLKQEVFSTPEFMAEAPKKFVLVEVDFPRNKEKIAPEVQIQNRQLMKLFGVQGFPTIYLLDAQGRPYAKTGYQAGGPSAYLKSLTELQAAREKRDAAWKKAKAAQGIKKAKLLAEGLAALDKELVPIHYTSVIAAIKKLDPENITGMKERKGATERARAKRAEDAKKAAPAPAPAPTAAAPAISVPASK